MAPKCPCKGCQDRSVTCHGDCEKYKAWKIEDRAVKEYLRKTNANNVSDRYLKQCWRNMRRTKMYGKNGGGERWQ